jgi:hypothetical protein
LLPAAFLALAGCGGGVGKLDSVTGKVTLDGKPLGGVFVNFLPDDQKGNKTTLGVSGLTDSDGTYHLQSATRARGRTYNGAPPGWYKITVTPGTLGGAPSAGPTEPGKGQPVGKRGPVPSRYETPFLSIEVVDSPKPEAYDLKLTSK